MSAKSKAPSKEKLQHIAKALHIELDKGSLDAYESVIKSTWSAYEKLCSEHQPLPQSPYKRKNIQLPDKKDNPLGAWYAKAEIKGANDGKLKGKTLAIKDNTNVAGLPMMNGSDTLKGYVPKSDATIVKRILDAGGTILGKAHSECLCFSGSSFTNREGPVLNPHDKTRSAGGSSSGSAVLVSIGEVDMATGGDQGGSIRIPSSWCGIYGMKPTYGLVPYTGVMPIEYTLDHVGPMTKTVYDNALLLEVMSGYDEGRDGRQPFHLPKIAYSKRIEETREGLKIGLLKEGFGTPLSDPNVDEIVNDATKILSQLGFETKPVSAPEHLDALSLWTVIATEGACDLMMRDDGYGSNHKGLYDTQLMAFHHDWRDKVNLLSDTVKLSLMLGAYAKALFHGRSYGWARNRVGLLRAAYDSLFQEVDVILMPTTPMCAHTLPTKTTPLESQINATLEMIGNTCPFNLTGHPAMSLPCGKLHGLPVGMMLVGRYFDELTLYQVAHTFEKHIT